MVGSRSACTALSHNVGHGHTYSAHVILTNADKRETRHMLATHRETRATWCAVLNCDHFRRTQDSEEAAEHYEPARRAGTVSVTLRTPINAPIRSANRSENRRLPMVCNCQGTWHKRAAGAIDAESPSHTRRPRKPRQAGANRSNVAHCAVHNRCQQVGSARVA